MTFNSTRSTTSLFASRALTGADEEPSAAAALHQAPATTPSPLHGASGSQSLLDAVMYRFGGLSGAGAQAASMSSRAASPTDMATSQKGVDLIKSFEGLRTTAYKDAVGVWTIGYGHTGSDVKPGMKITEAQAERLLRQDLTKFEGAVQRNVKVPLTQGQFDALVSFTYNLGEGNLKTSTLLKKLNQGDYAGAQAEFGKWTHAGGKELPGLVRRRKEEAAMFGNEGPSTSKPPSTPSPSPDRSTHDVKVRAGDTMTSIAEREGVSLSALIKANPQIKDPDRIFPDQTLHVPGTQASAPPPPSSGSSSKAVEIAKSHLGENASSLKRSGKLPMDPNVPSNICCANFVSAVLQKSGQFDKSDHTNSVAQLKTNLQEKGWHKTSLADAKPGDVVIIQGGGVSHTEIVASNDHGKITLVGSNNRNADGTQRITLDSGTWWHNKSTIWTPPR